MRSFAVNGPGCLVVPGVTIFLNLSRRACPLSQTGAGIAQLVINHDGGER